MLRRTKRGAWTFYTLSSRCRPTAVSRLGNDASWRVDRADLPLSPEAKSFTALVQERACAGGEPPVGRVAGPAIHYRRKEIGIAFFIRPLSGNGWVTCEGAPPVPVEVELDEAIGGRSLLDIGAYPPRLATPDDR